MSEPTLYNVPAYDLRPGDYIEDEGEVAQTIWVRQAGLVVVIVLSKAGERISHVFSQDQQIVIRLEDGGAAL